MLYLVRRGRDMVYNATTGAFCNSRQEIILERKNNDNNLIYVNDA